MTNAVGLTRTTNPRTIGWRFDGTWTYAGLVSNVCIFDRALSPPKSAGFIDNENQKDRSSSEFGRSR
jgi:hypothetical protein